MSAAPRPADRLTRGVREHLAALVADIERYPEFVPLCRAMRIVRRTQLADREIVVAEMQVAYKLIRESFTSRVTLIRGERTILVEYLDGPFRRMENRWTFHATTETTCDVGFFLAYEFKSRVLSMLMGSMFDAAFSRFAAAFEKRADQVYGKGV